MEHAEIMVGTDGAGARGLEGWLTEDGKQQCDGQHREDGLINTDEGSRARHGMGGGQGVVWHSSGLPATWEVSGGGRNVQRSCSIWNLIRCEKDRPSPITKSAST